MIAVTAVGSDSKCAAQRPGGSCALVTKHWRGVCQQSEGPERMLRACFVQRDLDHGMITALMFRTARRKGSGGLPGPVRHFPCSLHAAPRAGMRDAFAQTFEEAAGAW